MTRMTGLGRGVTGGVDTHADVPVAVVVDSAIGHVVAIASFATTSAGYARLLG